LFHALLLAPLGSVALASPQSELLRLMDETDADPVIAVSCQPMAPLARLLETIDLPGFNPREAPEGSWMSLLTPTRLAGAGVDVKDSLSVLFFDDRQIIVDVGFTGSEHQASALVASLLGLGERTMGTLGWEDGELLVGGRQLPPEVVDVRLDDARLTLRVGMPSTSGPTAIREIVARADAGPGCALTFDGRLPRGERPITRGRAARHVTGMVHVPLTSAPATARFLTGEPVPTALTASPGEPIGGTTSEAPAALMSIGVSLGDLLLDPALRALVDIAEDDVIALLSSVRFGPGTTIALFSGDPELGYVANLDVTRADGRPVGPARARRALQRALRGIDLPTERRSKHELELTLEQSTVWVATRHGGLVVGSHRARVLETATGRGTPWIRPHFAQLAARHPVAVRTEGLIISTLPPVTADLGISTIEGLWEFTFGMSVQDERKAAAHTGLAATLGALVLPHLLNGTQTARSGSDADAPLP